MGIRRFLGRGWLVAWIVLGWPVHGFTHPFHISTAEMEFNENTQRVEVSLKVHALDLERVLAKLAQRRKVDIEKDAIDELLKKYLSQHFYLMPAESARRLDAGEKVDAKVPRSEVRLVGQELETTWLWLYFELQPPKHSGELALVNTVLVELNEGQINTVSLRRAGKRHTMKMTAKQPWGALPGSWLESAQEPSLDERE